MSIVDLTPSVLEAISTSPPFVPSVRICGIELRTLTCLTMQSQHLERCENGFVDSTRILKGVTQERTISTVKMRERHLIN